MRKDGAECVINVKSIRRMHKELPRYEKRFGP